MSLAFTRRADIWIGRILVFTFLMAGTTVAGVYYYAQPSYTRVGYAPTQPVAYSHQLHVGQLGMSCLYCHTNVTDSPHSNVPATSTCMNCHQAIKPDSPLLAPIRDSYATGQPVAWERIHKVPGYVYFNHSVHVKRGVSCVSCHGQVNEMKVVSHTKPLSMGWCLECHREPEKHLRPASEVTNLDWTPPTGTSQLEIGMKLKEAHKINAPQHCGGCHR